MKKIFFVLVVVALVLLFGYFAFKSSTQDEQDDQNRAQSHKDTAYIIDGRAIKLTNGLSEIGIVPGAASKIVTQYFGNEIRHDFDGDGREDVAFILTQQTGGSGTFYYVVAALNTENGYIGSQGLFLGDRIAPQTTEISRDSNRPNVVVVNYANRAPGESFATSPSVGKSIWLLLDTKTMQFGEVAQNFEGEANPDVMVLNMKEWFWVKSQYNDDKIVKPNKEKTFSLKLDGNRVSIKTDCNNMSGSYTATQDKKITIKDIASTMMYCEGSQEGEFSKMLGEVSSYMFTTKGELILLFKFDSGSMMFR